jgi:hypothetical protein
MVHMACLATRLWYRCYAYYMAAWISWGAGMLVSLSSCVLVRACSGGTGRIVRLVPEESPNDDDLFPKEKTTEEILLYAFGPSESRFTGDPIDAEQKSSGTEIQTGSADPIVEPMSAPAADPSVCRTLEDIESTQAVPPVPSALLLSGPALSPHRQPELLSARSGGAPQTPTRSTLPRSTHLGGSPRAAAESPAETPHRVTQSSSRYSLQAWDESTLGLSPSQATFPPVPQRSGRRSRRSVVEIRSPPLL